MGPIHKADSRQAVVRRMIDLLDQAKEQKCDLVVYPELALTTFFPRWYMTEQAEVDAWFEREMPNAASRPLFEQAAQYRIGISFGYAELTADGHHFNTSTVCTENSIRVDNATESPNLSGDDRPVLPLLVSSPRRSSRRVDLRQRTLRSDIN